MNMEAREADQTYLEDTRKRHGQFYTPKAFADYAHTMLDEVFGCDWRQRFVVWDCAWGTGNLTRDYSFRELYASTLEQDELNLATDLNPESVKFQYDFLNDDFEKLPDSLRKAFLERKPILFLINPPYGTASNGAKNPAAKENISKTKINDEMQKAGIGKSAQNLYGQFLFRICQLKEQFDANVSVAVFSPALYVTGPAWAGFRKKFFNNFAFERGAQFVASHFADVKSYWGILFGIWRGVETGNETQKNDFVVDNLALDEKGKIFVESQKTLYNTDGVIDGSTWAKVGVPKEKVDAPQMTSALAWRETGQLRGSIAPNALGFFHNSSNNVYQSLRVFLMTSCAAHGDGFSVMPENYERVMCMFSARRLVKAEWKNDKDEFLAPNTSDPRFYEFMTDAAVYSLFESAANQSSMRGISYKGKSWDIKNEFFWMSREEMASLAREYDFEALYTDTQNSTERFVYNKLQTYTLSPESATVLAKASDIVRKSFAVRKSCHEQHPEFHLNAWDAGWYQIKKLLGASGALKEETADFNDSFRQLSQKMRELVYELGFLKK